MDKKHYPDVRDWLVQLMYPDAASRITAKLALKADAMQKRRKSSTELILAYCYGS